MVESTGVVVRRYIDFLMILIPTHLVSVLFCSSIPTFCSLKKCFRSFPVLLELYYATIDIFLLISFSAIFTI